MAPNVFARFHKTQLGYQYGLDEYELEEEHHLIPSYLENQPNRGDPRIGNHPHFALIGIEAIHSGCNRVAETYED